MRRQVAPCLSSSNPRRFQLSLVRLTMLIILVPTLLLVAKPTPFQFCRATRSGIVDCVCMSPDGQLVAGRLLSNKASYLGFGQPNTLRTVWLCSLSEETKSTRIYSSATWRDDGYRYRFNGVETAVEQDALAFSADGGMLAAASDSLGPAVDVWDTSSWSRRTIAIGDRHETARGVAFIRDGQTLAIVGGFVGGYSLTLHSLRGDKQETFPLGKDYNEVAVSADGRLLVLGGGSTAIWGLTPAKLLRDLPFSSSVAISPDGRTVAISFPSCVMVFDIALGKCVTRYSAGRNPIVAFCPDGKLAIACGFGIQLVASNVANAPSRSLACSGGDLTSLACCSKGNLIAAGTDDGKIIVWDLNTGTQTQQFSLAGEEPNGPKMALIAVGAWAILWFAVERWYRWLVRRGSRDKDKGERQ